MCAAFPVLPDTSLFPSFHAQFPHESAAPLGMEVSWRIHATNDWDGLVIEVRQATSNIDAVSQPFLYSNHVWE